MDDDPAGGVRARNSRFKLFNRHLLMSLAEALDISKLQKLKLKAANVLLWLTEICCHFHGGKIKCLVENVSMKYGRGKCHGEPIN